MPPFQHAQGAEGVPAAGRPRPFHLEVRLSLIGMLQRPAAILALGPFDNADGILQARAARGITALEIIQGPKNVIVPARRRWQDSETRRDRSAPTMPARQP